MTASPTLLIAGGGSGGHLMPALAIADGLRHRHPDWRLVLVGAERGVEAKLLPGRDFPYYLLPFEPIYRRQWWKNLRWPLLAVRLIAGLGQLFRKERPTMVIGTGGFAAGPVVWYARRRGLLTAILEQDAFPGLTTRRLAGRVDTIFLSVPEARDHLRPGAGAEVLVTGSPIVPPDLGRGPEARRKLGIDPDSSVVLVTGGGQGAVAINELVAAWIQKGLPAGVSLLWSTGKGSYERYRPLHDPPTVRVFDFIDPIADAYAAADLAVTRAGMMTLAELSAWRIPSLLIPLPTSAADHQRKNARAHAEAGAGVVVEQDVLDGVGLGARLEAMLADRDGLEAMAEAAGARGRPEALATIVTRVEAMIGA
ncbi:MAG: glycosyltransferase [Gemmatimonadales bacterium]